MNFEDKQQLKEIMQAVKDVVDSVFVTSSIKPDPNTILRESTIIFLSEKRDRRTNE